MAFLKKLAASGIVMAAALGTQVQAQSQTVKVPDPPRDFRGVWVATVENIDWPSTRSLTTEQQKQELISILDQARALNLNAIVLQIRPTMDALYKSDLEPWSLYLTGTQGKAPEPFYDPLEFAVTEAHKRGLQLHTWLNPYRAHRMSAGSTETLSKDHVSRTKPDIVRHYGSHLWLDPTDPKALAHNVAVFKDVVARYDVDGIHMDDYFYPYVEQDKDKKDIPFPDDKNWEEYKKSGGKLSRNDWRRSKVNELVQVLGRAIKEVRPTVQYGISPFGIWRPRNPESIRGLDQYDVLYADAKLWLNEGWVDYFTPQLYWRIQDLEQSYPVLLQWWISQNTKNRHIWPGLYTGKTGGKKLKDYDANEVINQIVITRVLGATGNIHFSNKVFQRNPLSLNERLTSTTGVYGTPALPPPSPWLDAVAPSIPAALTATKKDDSSVEVTWKTGGTPDSNPEDKVFVWAIYTRTGESWKFTTQPAHEASLVLTPKDGKVAANLVAVAAVDRLGNISGWSTVVTGEAAAADPSKKEQFGQVQ